MFKNQWEIIKKSKIQLFLFVCLLAMHSAVFSQQKDSGSVERGGTCTAQNNCKSELDCVGLIAKKCKQKMTRLNDLKNIIGSCLTNKWTDNFIGAGIGSAAATSVPCLLAGIGLSAAAAATVAVPVVVPATVAELLASSTAFELVASVPASRVLAVTTMVGALTTVVAACGVPVATVGLISGIKGAVGSCALDLSKEYYWVSK